HRDGRRPESEIQEARRRMARLARAQEDRATEWKPYYDCADFMRRCCCAARRARTVAGRLGPEHPKVWPLLEWAADVERDALAVEAELDAIFGSGRVG